MGVKSLQLRIVEALEIREAEASLKESRNNDRVARWLAILFGVIATPTLATEVIQPLWELFEWWAPEDAAAERLLYVLVAVVIVVAFIILLSRFSRDPER